jgi:hypothetical protein
MMEAKELEVIGTIAAGVAGVEGPWLDEEGQRVLAGIVDSQVLELRHLSPEGQEEILRLCMGNFGVFAALFDRLDQLPEPLKYALVSKGMYEMGLCGMPPGHVEAVRFLLDAVDESYWTDDKTANAAFAYRENVVRNPMIGPWPILDEYPNCPDLDVLLAILENPVCPQSISQDILNRNHFVFEEYDEEDLEALLLQAESNLRVTADTNDLPKKSQARGLGGDPHTLGKSFSVGLVPGAVNREDPESLSSAAMNSKQFCTHCGAKFATGQEKFCGSCGSQS